jgi:hypothetical protein
MPTEVTPDRHTEVATNRTAEAAERTKETAVRTSVAAQRTERAAISIGTASPTFGPRGPLLLSPRQAPGPGEHHLTAGLEWPSYISYSSTAVIRQCVRDTRP